MGQATEATAVIREGRIRIRAPYQLLNACRALPNRLWDPEAKEWLVPLSAPHAKAVIETMGSCLRATPELLMLAEKASPRIISKATLNEKTPDTIPNSKTKPWKHQVQGYWFTRNLWDNGCGGVLLAMEMGCGKSLTAIDLISSMQIDPVLILCPKPVISSWKHQFNLHSWNSILYAATNGNISERAESVKQFLDWPPESGKCRVVVSNYEAIDLKYPAFLDYIMSVPWQLVILDEIHRIKDPGGMRSRALSRLSDRVPRRLGLTGTPLPHSPMDAYAQYRFLDKRIFGSSVVAFKNRYAVMGGYGNHQIVSWRNQDEFTRLMGSIMFHVKSSDVLDLPEAIHVDTPIELDPETKKRYLNMENEFVCWVGKDQQVTASNALAKLLRLQQIGSGFLPDPESDRPPLRLSQEKEDALAEILTQIPQEDPVVVFGRFHHDLDSISNAAKRVGRASLELSGRKNELSSWQGSVGGEVLATQIQAGKEGIDLSRARYAIYFNQTFSLGDYEQSLARIRRPGQKAKTVFYYHLIATGTVDEKIRLALKSKKDVVQVILEEAKRSWTSPSTKS